MKLRNLIPVIMCAALCAGCNPKLCPPRIELPEQYIFGNDFRCDTVGGNEQWWLIFNDSTLNALIECAFKANRNLAVAASRIEEARNNLRVVRAQYLPSIDAGIRGGGEYARPAKITQSYTRDVSLSWEVSLFGEMRHAKNAAKAGIAYSEWAYRGVRLSLAAEVATTYFTLLQYRRDLDIARRSSQLRRESATLIDSMYRYGMATGVSREQAMSLVYTAEADIPLYERSIEQAMLSLNLLLGEVPTIYELHEAQLQIPTEYRPIDIPVGVPSDLLHRRPDVMEAYFQMAQAAANAGVARSARFPSLALTASGGLASDDIARLFSVKSLIWNAFLSITEPVFNFGALKRKEMIAREKYRQSALAYEQAYLQALSDVETALVSISTYRVQTQRYEELVKTSREVAVMTNALYDSGMSAYLDVIDAERTLYDSQMQFTNLVAQQYINYVNLCKALGGGWASKEPTPQDEGCRY